MKMDQKWSKNPEKVRNLFQAWFLIIFIIWTHKIQNFGIFRHFAPFFVIFRWSPKRANLVGTVSFNLEFLAKIMFYGSKTSFDIIWQSRNLLVKSPSKMASKNLNFSTMEFLVISAPIWSELITNTFQNEIWHTMRLWMLRRHIRDSQERPPDMISQSEFDQNQPRKAKNDLYLCMRSWKKTTAVKRHLWACCRKTHPIVPA